MPTRAVATRTPATERRRGVEVLLGLWTDVARDLVLIGPVASAPSTTRSCSTSWPPSPPRSTRGAAVAFLERAARSAEWLATNVSPELILDALVLAWPRRATVAA